jgi:hypothetical protein
MSNIQFKAQSFNNEYFKECERAGMKQISRAEHRLYLIGAAWYHKRRPFFNVYPGVEKCLKNTRGCIDPAMIPHSVLHDLGVMEIRFAESSSTPSFFIAILPTQCGNNAPRQAVHLIRKDARGIQCYAASFGTPAETRTPPINEGGWEDTGDDVRMEMEIRVRLAMGVMLLAADPRYCEPVLLNRDRDKMMNDAERQQALERAKKRGNFGFDLGRDVEVSPHFRRPHFAIRWTGKGSAIPRLVPVKGAIINEGLITNVPTGYEDAEQCETIDRVS